MNSIISEKRFAFVALPLLLATLALFYVLGAAALFAEAAQAHQDMARHGRSELVSPVIENPRLTAGTWAESRARFSASKNGARSREDSARLGMHQS